MTIAAAADKASVEALVGQIADEFTQRLKDTAYTMGLCVGPDDMNLSLRGLRTLAVRLRQHHQSGLKIAQWFTERPEILKVLYPALPGAPGHDIWKRDFTGSASVFSIVFNDSWPPARIVKSSSPSASSKSATAGAA